MEIFYSVTVCVCVCVCQCSVHDFQVKVLLWRNNLFVVWSFKKRRRSMNTRDTDSKYWMKMTNGTTCYQKLRFIGCSILLSIVIDISNGKTQSYVLHIIGAGVTWLPIRQNNDENVISFIWNWYCVTDKTLIPYKCSNVEYCWIHWQWFAMVRHTISQLSLNFNDQWHSLHSENWMNIE